MGLASGTPGGVGEIGEGPSGAAMSFRQVEREECVFERAALHSFGSPSEKVASLHVDLSAWVGEKRGGIGVAAGEIRVYRNLIL